MVNKNDIALVTEILLSDVAQSVQDTMKLLKPDDVEKTPGFVAKKKTLEIDESYYKRIMLRALGEYEEDLYDGEVSPISGVECQVLINDVKEFRDKLISGEFVLVEDTDMQVGDDTEYNELAIVQEEEKSTEVNSHTIPHPSPLGLEFTEVSSSGKTDTEYRNSTDGENEDDDLLGSEDEFDALRKIIVENLDVSDDNNLLRVRSTFSAFMKKLKRIKGKKKRTRKSIVKVVTETTLDVFEEQLTKYINNGYKIKYANIDTKAGNSGSGVRYYAIIHR